MSRTKGKIAALLMAAVMSCGLISGKVSAYDDCCFGDITVGVDFLYWSPCVGDLHYAVVGNTAEISESTSVRTKYLCPDWEPGVRAYVHVDDLWNNFSGGVAYTYYEADDKASTRNTNENSISFSYGIPNGSQTIEGNDVSAKWDLEYQSVDAYLSYALNVTCDPCFEVSAFSGIKWVSICEKRKDELEDDLGVDTHEFTFKRDLDVWGIGPALGLSSKYTFCDCIKVFSLMETSLIVGESDLKDTFTFTDNSEESADINASYKADDECVCFPGIHLMTGLLYETCLCDMEVAFRVGWEYIQYINAPGLAYYESSESGVRSSTGDRNLTLQGIFAGLNVSF